MIIPAQITYRNLEPSPAATARIQTETGKLDRYFPRITSCRVMVEAPHRHHKWGELFHIRIEIGVPGGELVVKHEPAAPRSLKGTDFRKWSKRLEMSVCHKDIYVAIHDAFKEARRRLEDHARKIRGDVKAHVKTNALRAEKLEA